MKISILCLSEPELCNRSSFQLFKVGRFSSAWQLGIGLRIFSHSRCHHARSRGGTASLIVVRPAG